MIKRVLILSFIFMWPAGVHSFSETNIPLTQGEKRRIEYGEIITRETPSDSKSGKAFEAVGLIEADIADIFQVLVTFEAYPSFMPNLDALDVLYKDSNRAILNYTLALPLGKIKKYRLSMRFERDADSADLQWEMVDWPGIAPSESIHDTTGYWRLRTYPEKKGSMLAVYHVCTDPGPIPFGLGWIVDVLTKNSVPDVLINTRKRVHESGKR